MKVIVARNYLWWPGIDREIENIQNVRSALQSRTSHQQHFCIHGNGPHARGKGFIWISGFGLHGCSLKVTWGLHNEQYYHYEDPRRSSTRSFPHMECQSRLMVPNSYLMTSLLSSSTGRTILQVVHDSCKKGDISLARCKIKIEGWKSCWSCKKGDRLFASLALYVQDSCKIVVEPFHARAYKMVPGMVLSTFELCRINLPAMASWRGLYSLKTTVDSGRTLTQLLAFL